MTISIKRETIERGDYRKLNFKAEFTAESGRTYIGRGQTEAQALAQLAFACMVDEYRQNSRDVHKSTEF